MFNKKRSQPQSIWAKIFDTKQKRKGNDTDDEDKLMERIDVEAFKEYSDEDENNDC